MHADLRKLRWALTLACGWGLVTSTAAQAATVQLRGAGSGEAIAVYRAAPGEINRVSAVITVDPRDQSGESSTVSFRGTPRPRLLGGGCLVRAMSIDCESGGAEQSLGASAYLGDRGDVATGNVGIYGEAGNDRLSSGSLSGVLDGGSGDDVLTGSNDLQGIPGDLLTGGLGNDRILGGGGLRDQALYTSRRTPVRIDLSRPGPQGAAGERDVLIGIEFVSTGRAGDTLIGSAARNTFAAGAGNDTINVVGGGVDGVSCGPGVDTVRADATDRLSGCERVTRR